MTAFGDRLTIADVTDELDSSWGEGGFNTRVSYYRDFILNATDHRAVFVPEPSSSLLTWIATSAVALVLARYRSAPMRFKVASASAARDHPEYRRAKIMPELMSR